MSVSTRTTRLVVLCAILGACTRNRPVATISQGADVVGTRWNATLTTPEAMRGIVQGQGTATATPIDEGRRTRLDISVSNMVSGGRHPWVLRTGQCGLSGNELVRMSDRNLLQIGRDGRGTASYTMDSPFQTTGQYFIAVMASNENGDQMIACGNLAPPASGIGR